MGDSYENGFCWLRCLVIHIQYTPFCTVNNLFMEGKRWRRPCNQSMARLWWIKSNTMTDLLSCWSIHSILHSLSPSLSTFISLHLWLSDLSSPNFWTSLYLSSLWTFQEYGGTWGPAHTPCKCCCERRISGWRNRGRERDRREGGNMWEGASHMDTGCCQARGRETVLSLSLAYTHTHTRTHCDFQEPFESFISRDGEERGGNSCGLYLHEGRRQTFIETKLDGTWVPCVTVCWIWWTYDSMSWCLKVVMANLDAYKRNVLDMQHVKRWLPDMYLLHINVIDMYIYKRKKEYDALLWW